MSGSPITGSRASVATAFAKYIDGLGGPRGEGDLEFDTRIPAPPDAAEGVSRELVQFASDLSAATNKRFSGWLRVAGSVGARDGEFGIPGYSFDGRESQQFARPPFVNKVVQLGASALEEARIVAALYRSHLDLYAGVSGTSAKSLKSRRRRWLHIAQLGLMGLAAAMTAFAFGGLASRLNEWPNTSEAISGHGTPTSTSPVYLVAATALIAALGVTAGFFRASRERSLAKAQAGGDQATGSAAQPGTGLDGERLQQFSEAALGYDEIIRISRATDDTFVKHLWVAGATLSAIVGLLIALGGYFRLESATTSRLLVAVAVWVLWGTTFFTSAAFITRISQHWTNVLPAEMDLTDYDRTVATQNRESAQLGARYVAQLVDAHRGFVVSACSTIVDHYYEANLVWRNNSRTEALDSFALEDARSARADLDRLALGDSPDS